MQLSWDGPFLFIAEHEVAMLFLPLSRFILNKLYCFFAGAGTLNYNQIRVTNGEESERNRQKFP